MSRHFTASIDFGYRRAQTVAAIFNLSAPMVPKGEWHAEFNLKQAREFVKRAGEIIESGTTSGARAWDFVDLGVLRALILGHMGEYIYQRCRQADQLGLIGRKRKAWLQKQSRKYRVMWS